LFLVALPLVVAWPEVVPETGMPSLVSLGLTSKQLYRKHFMQSKLGEAREQQPFHHQKLTHFLCTDPTAFGLEKRAADFDSICPDDVVQILPMLWLAMLT
jgi:hypothetical protein